MRTIKQKRITFWDKAWYVLKPFLIYMVIKTFILYFLALVIPSLPVSGISEWVEENSYILSAVLNGIASLIAAGFLINDFMKEVATEGEIDIDKSAWGQLASYMKKGFFGYGKANVKGLILSAVSGAVLAFVINIIIEYVFGMFDVGSARYDTVESIQYSVPLWLGIILYGVIAPFAEELVFRGVIYNRMKRFYSLPYCVIISALLFGVFHANLPQLLYGTIMGVLIALCYEKNKCFAAPVIFHMAANIFVFSISFL
jgi:membrane protease YdiL (CAAX protease family)